MPDADAQRGRGFGVPFVGRAEERARLESAFRDVETGELRIVLISGGAGMGKTRLVREVRPRFETSGLVLIGRCHEDAGLAYHPIVEALEHYVRSHPQALDQLNESDRDVLNRLLGRNSGVWEAPTTSGDAEQMHLSLSVSRLLEAAARRAPVVFIIDDLHWIDTPSLDVLSHLVLAAADHPADMSRLMVVCTYRKGEEPERVRKVVARFEREDVCQHIALTGLSDAETTSLIRGLGFGRPSHQLVVTVREATRGNPLFVQEAMANLAATGAIDEKGGYLVATVSPDQLKLPDEVSDAIEARIRRLAPVDHDLLIACATIGDAFDEKLVTAVTGQPDQEVLRGLERLLDGRFLVAEETGFRFSHPLMKHVVYGSSIGSRREMLHRRVALALETLHGDSLDARVTEIAHHLTRAGRFAAPEQVVEFTRRAADRAFGVYAWSEAARYYDAAVTAAERAGTFSAQDKARLHYLAGLAYYRDLDSGPSIHHLERAAVGFRETGDSTGLARVLIETTRHRLTQSATPYGRSVDTGPLEEVLEMLGEKEPALRGDILARLSQAYWAGRDTVRAEDSARRAIELGEQAGDSRIASQAASSLALANMQKMEVEEALKAWQSSLVHAREAGDPWLQGWPLARIPMALIWLGRIEEAIEYATEGRAVMFQSADWAEYSLVLAMEASCALAQGRFNDVEKLAQEGMSAMERAHYPWSATIFLPALACARFLVARRQEAADALELFLEPGRVFASGAPGGRLIVWPFQQVLLAHEEQLDQVRANIEVGARRVLRQRQSDTAALPAFCALAEAAALAGDKAGALEAGEAVKLAVSKGLVLSPGWVYLLPRVLGLVAAVNGRSEEAARCYDAAIAAGRAIGARAEVARTCLDYAALLESNGKAGSLEHAAHLIEETNSISEEIGMTAFAARTRVLADALSVKLKSGPIPKVVYPDRLTAREVEVIQLVARGRSNRQIAEELILSQKTVARHLENIFAKTGAPNRSAAAAYAFDKGIAVPGSGSRGG